MPNVSSCRATDAPFCHPFVMRHRQPWRVLPLTLGFAQRCTQARSRGLRAAPLKTLRGEEPTTTCSRLRICKWTSSSRKRMGEFYAALHDMMLKKNPKGVIVEYAWPSLGCGEPCPNERLLPHELMSLGGDFFDAALPEEERHPEPPELTEKEEELHKAKQKELATKPKELKEYKKTFEGGAQRSRPPQSSDQAQRVHRDTAASPLRRYYAGPKIWPSSRPLPWPAAPAFPKGKSANSLRRSRAQAKNEMQTRYLFYHPLEGACSAATNRSDYRWGQATAHLPWPAARSGSPPTLLARVVRRSIRTRSSKPRLSNSD